ncbi:hypothetical protein IQ250_23575 [Pseudanabaenaceae cyanobacterium LEGE 13415]|nr:hypothetical protein [Pseudanabaenaceae cyanobacterium LEGE 13415]
MEPLTLSATAVAATILTKAFEKTGEKLGEAVIDQSGKFLSSLKQKSPEIATAVELIDEQPLDYGLAVLEVDKLARKDSDFANEVQTLAESARSESNPKLNQVIQEIIDTLKSQQPTIQSFDKLADKIGLVVQQGGSVSIQTFRMD